MSEGQGTIVSVLLQSTIVEWITILGLIFGGCCSNAWALELATSQNPHAGSLITFAQFVLVSVYGFWKHITLVPAPTARKDLLRRTAAKLVEQYSTKGLPARRIYVAIEGRASNAFANELAHEIELLSRLGVPTRISSSPNLDGDGPRQLDSLWNSEFPNSSIVLVDGEHLHAGEFRTRWDYSIVLVSPQDFQRPAPVDAALTVDISSQTHPIVISPVPTHFNPLTLLRTRTRIRLKKRSIPISRWGVQVALFLSTSLLNNAAFGYSVPMTVHIIFRSGGLVANMVMGWLVEGRRYNVRQILSVVLVTFGVICTTVSASYPPTSRASTSSTGHYSVGILILTLALIMSGFMGLEQDRAYAKYGRGHWQEAMFYLHVLALPGFTFLWRDIARQIQAINAGTRVEAGLEMFGIPVQALLATAHLDVCSGQRLQKLFLRRISIPSFYFPLMLNIVTQLVCVSGVHRLTSQANSLTVALVLVVRKAVSLGISVALLEKNRGSEVLLWTGAGLVLAGTIGYSTGASGRNIDQTRKARQAQKTE